MTRSSTSLRCCAALLLAPALFTCSLDPRARSAAGLVELQSKWRTSEADEPTLFWQVFTPHAPAERAGHARREYATFASAMAGEARDRESAPPPRPPGLERVRLERETPRPSNLANSGFYIQTGFRDVKLHLNDVQLTAETLSPAERFFPAPAQAWRDSANRLRVELSGPAISPANPRFFLAARDRLDQLRGARRRMNGESKVSLAGPALVYVLEADQHAQLNETPRDYSPPPENAFLITAPTFNGSIFSALTRQPLLYEWNIDAQQIPEFSLALYAFGLRSPSRAYWNGVLIGSNGDAHNPQAADYDRLIVYEITADQIRTDGPNQLRIVFDPTPTGWFPGPRSADLQIMPSPAAYRRAVIDETPRLVVAAAQALIGLVFILLFSRRLSLNEYLLFGLYSLNIGVYFFFTGQARYWFFDEFQTMKLAEYTSLWLAGPLTLAFLRAHFPRQGFLMERIADIGLALYAVAIVYGLAGIYWDPSLLNIILSLYERLLPLWAVNFALCGMILAPHLYSYAFRVARRFVPALAGVAESILEPLVVQARNRWNGWLERAPAFAAQRLKSAPAPLNERAIDASADAWLLLIGVCAMAAAAYYDVMVLSGVAPGPQVSPLATFVLTFMVTGALASRLAGMRRSLEEKNETLLRMDELRDEFLVSASHELRTPLSGVVGVAESLRDGRFGALTIPAREQANLIVSSGRRLYTLVNDLLDFNRIKHGNLKLHIRPVSLFDALETAFQLTRPLAPAQNLTLINATPDSLPPAAADEERLQQILINLLTNALKFADHGEIRARAAAAGAFLQVSIEDDGAGVPAALRDRIFDTFEESPAVRMQGGLGIGLSITRKLVELHGGRIWYEALESGGSRFSFSLPVFFPGVHGAIEESDWNALIGGAASRSAPGAPATPGASAETSPPASAEGRTLRALAVDDEPVVRRVLTSYLASIDCAVEETATGQRALELIRAGEKFDIILIDAMLPHMSGYELCRQIRAEPAAAAAPIIMLTARSRMTEMLADLDHGANDFIAKPFTRQELLARVDFHLKLARTTNSLRQLNENLEQLVEDRTHETVMALAELTRREKEIMGELNLARAIQEGALPPRRMEHERFRTTAYYRAMNKVGGDFYDIVPLPGDRTAVLVADCSGHGVPAALVFAMARMSFDDAFRSYTSPIDVFESVNKALNRSVITHDYLTCFLLVFESDGVFRYSTAAHRNPFVLRRRENCVDSLQIEGMFLGAMDDSPGFYEERVDRLRPGDRVLLFTDGIVEQRDAHGAPFGMDRLKRLLGATADLDFDLAMEEILREWRAHAADAAPGDDVTLLLLEWYG